MRLHNRFTAWLKEWILIVAILAGVASYFIYVGIPWLDTTHPVVMKCVDIIQPVLIFSMLFVTFCKVDIGRLHLCRWHAWLLFFQCIFFAGLGVAVMTMADDSGLRIILEGAMICLICPVATAGAVVTDKLGGNAAAITTYTILINLVASLIIPFVVPFLYSDHSVSFLTASAMIMGKVFPLLLLPLIMAFLVKRLCPFLLKYILKYRDFSFYLWVVALYVAIAVTTHFIFSSKVSLHVGVGLVIAAGISCFLQFWIGWKIGGIYGDKVTAGQSMGQKNTVFAIWLGYTFFNPVTSLAGGFYSIFHNVVNSFQLHRQHLRQQHASPR